MKITRSLKAGAALAAVVGSLGAGAALAPAEAVAGCATGYTCLWDDTDYKTNDTSNAYRFQLYQAHMGSVKFAGTNITVGDHASSVFNQGTGGEYSYLFKDASCQGSSFRVAAGTGDRNLNNGTPAGDFNDKISSGAYSSQLGRCRETP